MQAETSTQTEFKQGELIMEQGAIGDCAYLIESGLVEIFIDHPDGSTQKLAERGAGTIIGEMAIVDRQRRTASVRALEDCKTIQITKDDFQRRLQGSDPVMKMIMQVILTRYRDTLARINTFGESAIYPPPEELERRVTSEGKTVENLKTTNEFKNAIKNKELLLHYQPIIALEDGSVKGFEALMRWVHPVKGFMPPNLFIPIAEDSGLIIEATDWAVEEACNALQRIKALCPDLPDDVFMSVNFTALDMLQPDFLDKLVAVTAKTKTDPAHIKLEMTERLLMNNPEKVRNMLESCRAKGFRVAIDDFGTGYSSLSYLHHYPIDTLKIDRSFIVQMAKDKSALNLVRGIINLGKSLDMQLVAEGIEEDIEARLLLEAGCSLVQGYKYSKPLAEEKLVDWIENR